jgi:proline dehydrogenase
MEKERERAAEKGDPSPIHDTKQRTDQAYDDAIDYCLKHHETMAFVAATHNEKSTAHLAEQMAKADIPPDNPGIFYSQLYGMGDNLSYVLAKAGFNVSKYVPYGPVADAVPYLMRRAKENSSAAGQMSRELQLIEEELKRRKLS